MVAHIFEFVDLHAVFLSEILHEAVNGALVSAVKKAPIFGGPSGSHHEVEGALAIKRALNLSFSQAGATAMLERGLREKIKLLGSHLFLISHSCFGAKVFCRFKFGCALILMQVFSGAGDA